MIKTKAKYLVTGGTGFLGRPLVQRLITEYDSNVVILSRNQGKLINLKQEFPSIEIVSGDVSDICDVNQAMQEVDGVFHLAASKHVGLAETLVRECVKSNTIGSMNILEASLTHKPDFVIGISTDKAAQVSGIYGASKLLMEGLFRQFQDDIETDTQYRIVRYGNVLYSTGSVLCKWLELIKQGKEIVVTDLEATRFFWTVQQALQLIEDCLFLSKDATPYVPSMKAMSIFNLLKAMIRKYLGINNPYMDEQTFKGTDGQSTVINFTNLVKVIGLQPGENKHEKILETGPTSNEVEQYTIEEIMELI